MEVRLSDQVRKVAVRDYVEPARRSGSSVEIPIGQMQRKLRAEGFPSGHIRQICTSLESDLFVRGNHLVRETPKGQSERVGTVLRFRFAEAGVESEHASASDPLLALSGEDAGLRKTDVSNEAPAESPAERAKRVTGKLRGFWKQELAEYGGAEGFIRYLRSDEEPAA